MDIRQLEYFIAVAQRGSFTKAAEELFISRQALSKAVRNLEHETGDILLSNKDGHLQLTGKGHALFDDAEPVVTAYHCLEERYLKPSGASVIRQTLSVAMAHGTALSLPENVVSNFRELHPDVLLSVEEVTTEAALDMVNSGAVDVGIVGSAPPYLGGFDLLLVVETGTYVYVPRESKLAKQQRLTLSDIKGQPFVTFGKRNHLHRFFVEACSSAGVQPNILLTTSDVNLLLRSAEQQQALYFGFPPDIDQPLTQTRVLLPLDLETDTAFGTYVIKRQGSALSSSARLFWEYLARL